MLNYDRMRKEGVQLAGECMVALKRVQGTTVDKAPSLMMSVEWLEEVEAKVHRAKWLMRQAANHARKREKILQIAATLPTVTDAMWRRLSPSVRSQLLLLIRKEEVVGKPGGSLVLYVLRFNVELAASIAKSLLAAARPRTRKVPVAKAG